MNRLLIRVILCCPESDTFNNVNLKCCLLKNHSSLSQTVVNMNVYSGVIGYSEGTIFLSVWVYWLLDLCMIG